MADAAENREISNPRHVMMAQKITIVGEHTEERDVRREPGNHSATTEHLCDDAG